MEDVIRHILERIRDAEIRPTPFPHLVISDIFPPDYYALLLRAIPPPDQFASAEYPGTGFGTGTRSQRISAGLAYPNLDELPIFGGVKDFLRGEKFCRALLEKFAIPEGIPTEKYRYFQNDAREFTSVFDLQIDRRGYEILPHPDVESKIVTFQFFLVSDASLKEFGTLFCRTRNGGPANRSSSARVTGKILDRAARLLGGKPARLWYWFERSKLGTEFGFGDSKNWYPWRMFEIESSAPALPNHFMAFAPNERSYHAVRMSIPDSSPGRTVLRGFIRSGSGRHNYIRIKDPQATDAVM